MSFVESLVFALMESESLGMPKVLDLPQVTSVHMHVAQITFCSYFFQHSFSFYCYFNLSNFIFVKVKTSNLTQHLQNEEKPDRLAHKLKLQMID